MTQLNTPESAEQTGTKRWFRRFLRPFYKQYVVVLLIILVFNIGLAVRPFSKPLPSAAPAIIEQVRSGNLGGEIVLSNLFTRDGSAQIAPKSDLITIEEVLRNRNIRAVFKLYVPLKGRSGEDIKRDTDLGVSRSVAIKRWLLEKELPNKSFDAVVLTIDYPGATSSTQRVAVALETLKN